MPHRATYIFPRQFPDTRGSFQPVAPTSSSTTTKTATEIGIADYHEKKRLINKEYDVIKGCCSSSNESDAYAKELLVKKFTGNNFNNNNNSTTLDKSNNNNKLAAFYSWIAANNNKNKKNNDKKRYDEQELLLPAVEVEVEDDQKSCGLYRGSSLARLSSYGSSYGGGSFFSSEVQETRSTVRSSIMEVEEREKEKKQISLADKARESYYMQLTLTKRLASHANLGNEQPTMFLFESGLEGHGSGSDPEALSYRLWVLFFFPSICIVWLNLILIDAFILCTCTRKYLSLACSMVKPSIEGLFIIVFCF